MYCTHDVMILPHAVTGEDAEFSIPSKCYLKWKLLILFRIYNNDYRMSVIGVFMLMCKLIVTTVFLGKSVKVVKCKSTLEPPVSTWNFETPIYSMSILEKSFLIMNEIKKTSIIIT